MAWINVEDVYQLSHDGARMDQIDNGVIVVTVPISAGTSGVRGSASNSAITANHVVLNAVVANPAAQTGNWTWTTAAGSVSISGAAASATTVTLYLGLQNA